MVCNLGHHTELPAAERHDRKGDPDIERTLRLSSSLRTGAAYLACRRFYNTRRPHQAVGIKTPGVAYDLTVWTMQKTAAHYVLVASARYSKRQSE
jgi:hypothetical protein